MEIKKIQEIWQTVEAETMSKSPFFTTKEKAVEMAKINGWKSYYIYKYDLFK